MDEEDDMLVAVVEDELRDLGLDEESIVAQIDVMRDEGHFRVPHGY